MSPRPRNSSTFQPSGAHYIRFQSFSNPTAPLRPAQRKLTGLLDAQPGEFSHAPSAFGPPGLGPRFGCLAPPPPAYGSSASFSFTVTCVPWGRAQITTDSECSNR